MIWFTKKTRRFTDVQSSKLRLESLEERQLLSAVGWEGAVANEQVPYEPEFRVACDERCESAVDLTAVQDVAAPPRDLTDNYSILKTTEGKSFLTVTSTDDQEELTEGTLRYAIKNAAPGDTITFDSSLSGKTITLKLGQLEIDKSLTIDASELYDEVKNTPGITIDADGTSRISCISSDVTNASVKFVGIVFVNGKASEGGAIYSNGTLELDKCVFTNNHAVNEYGNASGGAIYQCDNTITILNSVFDSNMSSAADTADDSNSYSCGGAIYQSGGDCTIIDTTFDSNTSFATYHSHNYPPTSYYSSCSSYSYGGAICQFGGACMITNSTFDSNTSSSDCHSQAYTSSNSYSCGGAIYQSGDMFTITNSTFDSNTSSSASAASIYNVSYSYSYGGAIYQFRGGCEISNSTFDSNTSSSSSGYTRHSSGGAIFKRNDNISISGSKFTQNSTQKGGAVYLSRCTFTSTNVTIAGNSATQEGGGFYVHSTLGEFYNSIIVSNTAGTNADIASSQQITGSNNLSSYSNWDGNDNYTYDTTKSLFEDTENGDYSLAADSQAINRGDNQRAYVAGLSDDSTDLAGNPRFVGSAIDIGAYECQKPFDPTVVDTLNDSSDPNDGEWSLREAIAYATDYVTITFDSSLKGETIELNGTELIVDKPIKIDASSLYDEETKTPGITINACGNSRVATISAGTTEMPVVFSGLTLTGGKTTDKGGAIQNTGALTLNDVTFQDNEATKNGGAIFNDFDAMLTINGGKFSDNLANNGGAVANYGTTTISGATTISSNNANRFGGAYFGCGELTVDGETSFELNVAGLKGGAIYNDVNKSDVNKPRVGVVTINGDDVKFDGNSAGERGGAIQTYSKLSIGGTATFSGNKASDEIFDSYGGAIDVGEGGSATLSGALTFGGNTADFGGAIFSTNNLTFAVDGDYTFKANVADRSGGAIDAIFGTLTLGGSFTFTSNKANGNYNEDSSGVGGAIAVATTAENTTIENAVFVWDGNSAAWGNCVAFDDDCGISVETLELDDVENCVIFNELIENSSSLQSLLPTSISPNAVEATITVEGVKTTFGSEGVTPQQLGLGVGTYEALVQYVDANGGTSATRILKLTVKPGASVEVRETAIADGRGVKFDFNLTKADGGAVSVWEVSWGDGTTSRSENLSESYMAAHCYKQDGTFDVSLKVVYIDGTSETFEAFSTQKIGTPVAKSEVLSAVFEDVDDLFEDAFVNFENPNVYGPAFLR